MATADFWYGLVLSTILAIAASVSCLKCISCRCGSSNKNYTHCIEEERKEQYNCNTWAKCQTCKNNTTHCITCPSKQLGSFCTEGFVEHIRKKRGIFKALPATHCLNIASIHHGRVLVLLQLNGKRPYSPQYEEEDDYELPVGTRLLFSCDKGYLLEGVSELVCEDSGYWSQKEKPVCVEVRCEISGPVSHGRVFVNFPSIFSRRRTLEEVDGLNFPVGTRLKYVCNKGYTLLGSKTLFCMSPGKWSSSEPTCNKECRQSPVYSKPAVLSGTNAKPGEWPWTVAITVKENSNTKFQCAGVLLNSRTVLTVAHCVERARDYILYFGLFDLKFDSKDQRLTKRKSSQVILHPNFNNKTFDNDIALITFFLPVFYRERIQPVCLPSTASTEKKLVHGEMGYVSGWEVGRVVSPRRFSPVQQLSVIQIPIVSKEICAKHYAEKLVPMPITPGMFCAGVNVSDGSFCTMSSGSPMVFYNPEDGRYTLEGLVSWGSGEPCEKIRTYYVLTRVETFMQWILDKLDKRWRRFFF